MSTERIRIALDRDGDDWTATVIVASDPSTARRLIGVQHDGSGPADALERLGQALDVREVERIKRERGI